MLIELHVETKHNLPKELEIVSILQDLQLKYQNLPIFTTKIVIESGSLNHSHPVLTLNIKETKPLSLMKLLIHEQFHWYSSSHQLHQVAITNLKTSYKDLGDCNIDGKHPDSFWEHLIVCWNTRNALNKILTPEEVSKLYAQPQGYPLSEKFVADNFDKIKADLAKFDLIYE